MAKKPTKPTKTSAEPLGLVGRAFQLVNGGAVERHGVVRGQLTEQHFLVQYGGNGQMQVVDIEEMTSPSWQFFESLEQMEEANEPVRTTS